MATAAALLHVLRSWLHGSGGEGWWWWQLSAGWGGGLARASHHHYCFPVKPYAHRRGLFTGPALKASGSGGVKWWQPVCPKPFGWAECSCRHHHPVPLLPLIKRAMPAGWGLARGSCGHHNTVAVFLRLDTAPRAYLCGDSGNTGTFCRQVAVVVAAVRQPATIPCRCCGAMPVELCPIRNAVVAAAYEPLPSPHPPHVLPHSPEVPLTSKVQG